MNGETCSALAELPASTAPAVSAGVAIARCRVRARRRGARPRACSSPRRPPPPQTRRLVHAVVEADRVEAVPEAAQVREQADRPGRPHAGLVGHESRTASASGTCSSPKVVAAAEAREAGARREQAPAEQRGELVEIDVGEREPIAELVRIERRWHAAVIRADGADGCAVLIRRWWSLTAGLAIALPRNARRQRARCARRPRGSPSPSRRRSSACGCAR